MTDDEKPQEFVRFKPRFVSEDGRKIAKEISKSILPDSVAEIRFVDDGPIFTLPSELLQLVRDLFKMLPDNPVVVPIPEMTELSIAETAKILFVSEEYVSKLLDSGKLKSHHLGQRHIFLGDVLEYHQESKLRQYESLVELVRLSEEMGLYDDVPENYYQGKEKRNDLDQMETESGQ